MNVVPTMAPTVSWDALWRSTAGIALAGARAPALEIMKPNVFVRPGFGLFSFGFALRSLSHAGKQEYNKRYCRGQGFGFLPRVH